MTTLSKVQKLTVAELAELWAIELRLPVSTVEREIRIALFKIKVGYPIHEDISPWPSEEALPTRGEFVDRDFVEKFCGKQFWTLPGVWFNDPPTGPSFPGRPSVMAAILHKLRECAATDALETSLAQQARVLEVWAKNQYIGQQTPSAKSIENGIRADYKQMKLESH